MFLSFALGSCQNSSSRQSENNKAVAKTPVTVAAVSHQNLYKGIWLNAVSAILNQSNVKSTVNGYVIHTRLRPGQRVRKGQVLFVLKTQEAQVLGNMLPDSLNLNGKITIRATTSGYISQLNHLQGDFVQQSEPLCSIADQNSFVFQLQVPFALTHKINRNQLVEIKLPDGRKIQGIAVSTMPTVEAGSQIVQYLLRVSPKLQLPANLVAKVKIITASQTNVQVVPKSAVLSDVSLSHFWVMKLINDTTAIKVPITKGIKNDSSVAILSPKFSQGSQVLISGNYGLPDTAYVTLTKTKQ